MDHLAIMKKSWGLTEKILTGKKRIESRWYKFRHPPWDKITSGDNVYFKDSGESVTIKAEVEKVLQFSDLNREKVWEIFEKYGKDDGIEPEEMQKFYEIFKDRKYCILVFLKNPQMVEAFEIDKKGFGNIASWISVNHIEVISRN